MENNKKAKSNTFKSIDISDAKKKINTNNVTVIDIRDKKSFNNGHIEGAINISNKNFNSFINNTNKEQEIIVCCYHGNSSKNAADLLINFGFMEVYSLDGGYEMWTSKLKGS